MDKRRLGFISASAIVVGNTIGAGVFTTSGFALADLGKPSWVLIAWAVGGVVAMCGALSYAAIARRIPESGGEYIFLARTFHPLAGFLAGWVSLLAGFTAPIAAAALAFDAYLRAVLDLELSTAWTGTVVIAMAAAMHGLRLSWGTAIQNMAVALKLIAITLFVVASAWLISGSDPSGASAVVAVATEPSFDLGAFAVTLVWISFSYAGWNAAVYVAGEVRDPERVVTRAVVSSTALIIAVYLALNAVFVFSAPVETLAGRPDIGAVAAEAIGGPWLRDATSIVVGLALFTSISAMVMAGPRVYARMAHDGVFPKWLARGDDAPAAAVALQSGLAIAVVWMGDLAELLGYIGFVLGLSSAAAVSCLFVLRAREGSAAVPAFGYPFVPVLFIAVTLWSSAFLIAREPAQAAAGALTVAVGFPVYFYFARRAGSAS